MKKVFLLSILIVLLVLPSILAIDLEIQKISSNEVLVPETGQPVVLGLEIKNSGNSGTFSIYNLAGFSYLHQSSKFLLERQNRLKLVFFHSEKSLKMGFTRFPIILSQKMVHKLMIALHLR